MTGPAFRRRGGRTTRWSLDLARHRRNQRVVVVATTLAGVRLLRSALSSRPGSRRFYALTSAAAGTWIVGGLAGSTDRRSPPGSARPPPRSLFAPIAVGVVAFSGFYGAALATRRLPLLNEAITDVLEYAHRGSGPLVAVTTLGNGVGEELFFRGAVYSAAGTFHPVAVSTAVYVAATTATGNPALVLASTAMGTLFALQRRASGGVRAPLLTHLVWSGLVLRFLPPLFKRPTSVAGRPLTSAFGDSGRRESNQRSQLGKAAWMGFDGLAR